MRDAAVLHFPTTRWSLLARARDADPAQRREALEQLLRIYWAPIRHYIVAVRGVDAHLADDLAQAFIARQILECNLLEGANREKGRFRSLLLTAVDRFVSNCMRDSQAAKRGGPGVISLERAQEPFTSQQDPSRLLAMAWAREVIGRAVGLMQAHCQEMDRPQVWGLFDARVLSPALHGTDPVGYGELVKKLKLTSPAHASNLLVTAKRMFVRCLRQIVSEYESEDALIDQEIADLKQALSGK